jgi:transposase
MPIIDRAIQAKRRKRVSELLAKGLTTRQISERVGVTTRMVLRVKKEIAHAGEASRSQHPQGAATT